MGTAGWEITDGNMVVLIDPYISRLKLGEGPSVSSEDERKQYSPSDYFESDYELIDKLIPRADYILVHHSHFDHLSDVPYIAKKSRAKVIDVERGAAQATRMIDAATAFIDRCNELVPHKLRR